MYIETYSKNTIGKLKWAARKCSNDSKRAGKKNQTNKMKREQTEKK